MAANTANLTNNLEQKVTQLQVKRRKLADNYKKEKKVEVTISPMYRPYFGNNMPVVINGIAVYVPIDGQTYKIPESFAALVKERITLIDEQLRAREAMADVQANVEKYAGEKGLLTKV